MPVTLEQIREERQKRTSASGITLSDIRAERESRSQSPFGELPENDFSLDSVVPQSTAVNQQVPRFDIELPPTPPPKPNFIQRILSSVASRGRRNLEFVEEGIKPLIDKGFPVTGESLAQVQERGELGNLIPSAIGKSAASLAGFFGGQIPALLEPSKQLRPVEGEISKFRSFIRKNLPIVEVAGDFATGLLELVTRSAMSADDAIGFVGRKFLGEDFDSPIQTLAKSEILPGFIDEDERKQIVKENLANLDQPVFGALIGAGAVGKLRGKTAKPKPTNRFKELVDAKKSEVVEPVETPKAEVPPKVEPKPSGGVKEPFEMTRAEFLKGFEDDLAGNTGQLIKTRIKQNELLLAGKGRSGKRLVTRHERAVRQALLDGKTVPPEVLKDFPDLAPSKPTVKVETPKGSTTLGLLGTNPDVLKSIGTDAIKTMKTISESTDRLIQDIKGPAEVRRGVQAAKDVMIGHDRQIRRSESTSKLLEKVVDDVVPKQKKVDISENRQMLMVHAYETKMKGKYWDKLTETEKGMVRWAANEKIKLNKFIKDNKILDMMESESINHITHSWIDPKTGKPFPTMYGKFSKGLPQSKQRTIPTYEIGIKKGLEPATTNLGKLIGVEWESATRAHQSRMMFKTLHNIGAEKGIQIQLRVNKPLKNIRMVERWDQLTKQGLTDGYERYSHYSLDKAITFKNSDGRLTTIKGAVGIRKELFPFVKAYIESPNYGALDRLNFATKSLKLGFSFFHVVSLGFQELANFRVPFKNIPRGLRIRKDLDPTVRLLHQEGLELFKGYEDVGFQESFFEGKNVWSRAGNTVTKPIELMRHFIFDIVQPGMKTSFVFDTFNKVLPEYIKGDISLADARLQIESGNITNKNILRAARQSVQAGDGHFSGEAYKRSLLETNRFMVKLYFEPQARAWWQRLMLSPTWQREHLIVAKNVAKSFLPDKAIKKLGLAELGPIKAEYRKYALGAVAIIGAVDAANLITTYVMDGEAKHIWENPKGKGFAIRAGWNEPSYTVTDKNGKERTIQGGRAYVRPLKSIYEIAEFVTDPVQKFAYKLSPFATAIGRQFFGGKYQTNYEGVGDIPERVYDFILDVATPITASQATRLYAGKIKPQSVVLPFVGFPTSKDKFKSRDGETRRIRKLIDEGKLGEAKKFRTLWNRHHTDETPIESILILRIKVMEANQRRKIKAANRTGQ